MTRSWSRLDWLHNTKQGSKTVLVKITVPVLFPEPGRKAATMAMVKITMSHEKSQMYANAARLVYV